MCTHLMGVHLWACIYGRVSQGRPMGAHLKGLHLMGLHFIGVHPIGVLSNGRWQTVLNPVRKFPFQVSPFVPTTTNAYKTMRVS